MNHDDLETVKKILIGLILLLLIQKFMEHTIQIINIGFLLDQIILQNIVKKIIKLQLLCQ